MKNNARTAADTGLPNDCTVDLGDIGIRLLRVHHLLGLDLDDAEAIIEETGTELVHALTDFCRRNEVSLDWLVLGEGPVMTNRGRQNIAREV